MAERLEGSPFVAGRYANRKYDWESWLDGSAWQLTQGVDFDVSLKTFRGGIYGAAARYGKTVRVKMLTDGVIMQAFPQVAE